MSHIFYTHTLHKKQSMWKWWMGMVFLVCSGSFMNFVCLHTEELPYLKCPLHTVLKLTPVAYGKSGLLLVQDIKSTECENEPSSAVWADILTFVHVQAVKWSPSA